MSLINDMLKDLASRQNHMPTAAPPQMPRRLPQLHAPAWWRSPVLLQAALTVVLAAGVAWWVAQRPNKVGFVAVEGAVSLPTPPVLQGAELPPLAPTNLPPPSLQAEAAPALASEPAPPSLPIAVPDDVPHQPGKPPAALAVPAVAPAPPPAARTPVTATAAPSAEPTLAAPPAPKVAVAVAPRPVAPPPSSRVLASTGQPAPRNEAPARTAGAVAVPAPAPEDRTVQAERRFQQALAEQQQGQPDQALASLQAVLALAPRHVNARLTLARWLVERKQATAAADVLADGLMLLPQQTDFMLALAPLWIQAGQQNDAMALLAQGVRSANNNPAFHAYYASQLLRMKRQAEAAAHFRVALSSNPAQHEWLLGLGLSLQATGQPREAVEAFRQSLATGKLSPQSKSMVEQVIVKLQTPTQ